MLFLHSLNSILNAYVQLLSNTYRLLWFLLDSMPYDWAVWQNQLILEQVITLQDFAAQK